MDPSGKEDEVARIIPPSTRSQRQIKRGKSRVPEDSLFYTRVVPILLASMAVLTVVLIVVAAGVLLGFVPFQ